ncbi:hypothetical protein [Kitasatospora sp. McL0602]|uniref:hypothetical protein n=1 Tax=Kitasatospora sp. McL0602 TaxID=3439530 RepID=UPI003F897D43
MKAEEVWRLWRRILREPALSDAVIAAEVAERAAEFGLTPEETAIAAQYAANGKGVAWAVDAYRFRLVRVTRYAVAEGAPLTALALEQLGQDLPALARSYVEASGWTDRGPYVYTVTADYLDHLRRTLDTPGAASAPGLFDIIALEYAGALLVARHAAGPPVAAADGTAPRWTGRGALVRVGHDILGWLADPQQTDLTALPAQPRQIVVRLDGSPDHYSLNGIGESAALVAEALATGADLPEIAALVGLDPADAGLRGLLETFADWGLVTPGPPAISTAGDAR